jgi:DNA helicase-2/ATP-dependent DNA helicase PcrA
VTRSAWGAASYNPASRFLEEVPPESIHWERTDAAYSSWSGRSSTERGGIGGRGESRFVGNTPKAAELASRLGLDASKLSTASELARADVPALSAGDRVNHQRWGLGRVVSVEGNGVRAQAQIDFGDQVMWIVLRHAPIEKV